MCIGTLCDVPRTGGRSISRAEIADSWQIWLINEDRPRTTVTLVAWGLFAHDWYNAMPARLMCMVSGLEHGSNSFRSLIKLAESSRAM